MKITRFKVGPLDTNCYVIESENSAAIIDPGGYSRELSAKLDGLGEKLKAILLTHCHFDHTHGISRVQGKRNVPVCIFESDAAGINDSKCNGLGMFGLLGNGEVKVERTFSDGEVVDFGDLKIKVIHTPGHSAGSCCYICEDVIFSGDTLFKLGFGRTDIGNGSFSELVCSLNKLFALEGDYQVLSGHGPQTTLDYERKNNPILQG